MILASGFVNLIVAQTQQKMSIKIGDISATAADRITSEAISQIALADINKFMDDFNHPYTFQTVFADAGGSNSGHTTAITDLTSKGVHFILGGDIDSMANASLSYINKNNILLLSSGSRASPLAISGDNLLRLSASDLNIGISLARMLWSKGVKYTCVLQRVDAWADGVYAGFDAEWRSLGGQYIGAAIKYPTSTTLFANYLNEIESQIAIAAPLYTVSQIGFFVISLDEIVTIIDQVSSRPYIASVNWYSTDRLAKNQALLTAQRYFVTGVHIYCPLESWEPTLKYIDVAQRFKQITGRVMGEADALRYDWYWIIALTVVKNGSADPSLAKVQIPGIAASYIGVTGRCKLNTAGDRGEPQYKIWGYAYVNNVYSAVEAGWIDYPTQAHWFSLEKPALTISYTSTFGTIYGNESILISGSTSPQRIGTSMTLAFWDPDNVRTDVVVKTITQGKFNTTLVKPDSGVWHIQALWAGDDISRASRSPIASFTVYRTITSISISVNSKSILIGEGVRVNGTLKPGFIGAPMEITYRGPSGSVTTKTVSANAKGFFEDSFAPGTAGNWTVVASFRGDLNYLDSTSVPKEVQVKKRITSINVLTSAASVVEKGNVSVYGQLTPALVGKQVKVIATSPTGTATSSQATTDTLGRYSASLHPADIGVWSFSALYAGDDTYLTSTSGTTSLTVTRAPPKATIKIFVKDGQAKGLQGASVTSTAQPSGQSTLSGTTSADGSVIFSLVTPGDYSFLAALSGYNSGTVSLNSLGGETTEKTVVLIQQSGSGIPGFPVEAVVLGALISIFVLMRPRRRNCVSGYW
jgi:ABC-type branched-subunit amino acid transport system substrate-binding protein